MKKYEQKLYIITHSFLLSFKILIKSSLEIEYKELIPLLIAE